MRVYTHPACLAHDTGPDHAERPARLTAVVDALRRALPALDWHEAPRATRGQLLRAHAPELLDAVLARRTRRAFCAVRPPGHHATGDVAMGFCLFNNIAVAALHALDKHGLERVAIVDFDVHHGNGTQAIFERDPRVLFASSHQWPLYPETGARNETGVGNIVNMPLPVEAEGVLFRRAWADVLLPAVDDFRPQLLLVSAGFDAHWRDPLAQLRLQAGDYTWISEELVALANRHCGGRMVSSLEGGYDLAALAESSVAHVGALCA